MKLKYRPEIDGLRTIAVLAVIIYHAEFTLGSRFVSKGGFLGVDVFFVISGFLITSLILGEYQRTERFSFTNFYERRVRRILPALLTTMLVSLPFAWKLLLPTQLIDFSKSLIASLVFGSNFYWHTTLQEYGTESALLKPFLHTWSLAVEEQYYIIFPLILFVIYRWYKRHTIVILTAGLILSLLFAELATAENLSFSFYMLPSRLWEMIAGALLANFRYFYPQKTDDSLLHRIMPPIGLFLIVCSIIFTGPDATHPGFITLAPVLGTVLIIWYANKKDPVTKVLSTRPFVWIGLISYSLYLWHYPIFAFSRIDDLNPPVYVKFLWIILTFALSIATYFLIERPFRNREAVSRKTLLVALLGTITIVGAYSFYSIQNDGVKARFPTLIKIYGKNEFDNQILKDESWNILGELAKAQGLGPSEAHEPSVFEAEHLWFSNSPTTKKVLIIGNSHSKDLFNALYQNKDLFPDLEFARFGMHNAILPEQVEVLFDAPNFKMADIVIISFRYDDTGSIPNLIDELRSKSKEIVLVLNPVEFNYIDGRPVFDWYAEVHHQDFSPRKLKRLFFNNQSDEKDRINQALRKIEKDKDVLLLDEFDFVCEPEARTCDGITDDGYKSFYDGYGHFTLEGARYFGQRIHEINWLETESTYEFPESIDPSQRYMFYLHGKIIEDQGIPAISPDYGEYEYEAILKTLRGHGFTVISEQRPKDTDSFAYAKRVRKQVEVLIEAGVPAGNITVVGASKGAAITILVSHLLQNNEVNFVLLGACHPDTVDELMQDQVRLVGNVLSIYDSVDQYAGSCQEFFSFSALSTSDEIVLEIGTGHGILYQPLDEWVIPTTEWAKEPTPLP